MRIMKKRWNIIKIPLTFILIGLVIIGLVVGISLLSNWGLTRLTHMALPKISSQTGYHIVVAEVQGPIWHHLTIRELQIINPLASDTLLTADQVSVDFSWRQLLAPDQISVRQVLIRGLAGHLAQDSLGAWNWQLPSTEASTPDTTSSPLALAIDTIEITDSRLKLQIPNIPLTQVTDLSAALRLSISPDGSEVELNYLDADIPESTPAHIRLAGEAIIRPKQVIIPDFRLTTEASSVQVQGSIELEPLSLDLAVKADSVAVNDLSRVLPIRSTMTGQFAFEGTVTGPPEQLAVSAGFSIEQFNYASWTVRQTTGNLRYYQDSVVLSEISAHVNDAHWVGLATIDAITTKPVFWGDLVFRQVNPARLVTMDNPPDFRGDVSGRIIIAGQGLDPDSMTTAVTMTLDPASRFRQVKLDRARVEAEWQPPTLHLKTLELVSGSSKIFSAGMVHPKESDLRVSITDFHLDLLADWLPEQNLTGTLNGELTLTGAMSNPNLAGQFRLNQAMWDSVRVDSTRLMVDAAHILENRHGQLRLDSFGISKNRLDADYLHLTLNLEADRFDVSTIQMQIEDSISVKANLQVWPHQCQFEISIPTFQVTAPPGQIWIEKPIQCQVDTGRINIQQFIVLSTMGGVELFGDYGFSGDVNLSGDVFDLDLQQVMTLAGQESLLAGLSSGSFTMGGKLPDLSFFLTANVDSLCVQGMPLGHLSTTLAYADRVLAIPELSLYNQEAMLFASGFLPLAISPDSVVVEIDKPLEFSTTIQQNPLTMFNIFLPADYFQDGHWSLTVNASGTPQDPLLTGDLAIVKGVLADSSRGLTIRAIDGFAYLDPAHLVIDSLVAAFSDSSQIMVAGDLRLVVDQLLHDYSPESIPLDDLDLILTMNDFALGDLVSEKWPGIGQVTGRVNTEVRLTGTPVSPYLTTRLVIDDLHHWHKSLGKVTLSSSYDGQEVVLDSLSLFNRNRRRVLVNGQIPLPITGLLAGDALNLNDYRIHAETYYADLSTFLLTIPDVFVNGGYVNTNIDITGRNGVPQVTGTFGIEHGALNWLATDTDLSGLKLMSRIERDTVFVDTLTAQTAPKGRVNSTGWIALSQLQAPVTHLKINAQDFEVRDLNDFSARMNADLTITGPANHMRCAGSVKIKEGLITMPFEEESESAPAEPQPMPWEFDFIQLDLDISGPSIWLRNRQAEIELDAALQTVTGDRKLAIAGDVNILRGTYEMYDYSFNVTQGDFTFFGSPIIDPQVLIVAETKLRVTESEERVNVPIRMRMTISGTFLKLQQPVFDVFDAVTGEPLTYSESDALLALSVGYTQSGLETLNSTARDKLLSRVGGMLNNQLSQTLRKHTDMFDTINLDTNLFGGETSATVTVGKYLSDDVFVSYSQGLPFSLGNKVRVEYKLNRWNTVIGERETESDQKVKNDNYHVDWKIKYRF